MQALLVISVQSREDGFIDLINTRDRSTAKIKWNIMKFPHNQAEEYVKSQGFEIVGDAEGDPVTYIICKQTTRPLK